MKHLLLTLWVTLFLVSCNKGSSGDESHSSLLRFGTNEAVWTTTRGADYTGNTGTNPIPDMLVYGYYTNTKKWAEDRTPAFPLFMDATVVTNNSGTWTYSPLQYFYPIGYHSFFAFAPYQTIVADSGNNFYFPVSSETPVLKYHLPEEIANHKDLLLGWNTDVQNGTDLVEIAFNHITTKITFSARVANDYTSASTVKINSILLSDIYSAAEASIVNESSTIKVQWQNYNELRSVAATIGNNALKENSTLTTTMQPISKDTLYMIPQTLETITNDRNPAITLSTVELSGGTERHFSKTFYLGELGLIWKPGEVLNFQITYSGESTEILLLVDPGTGDPGTLTPIE